MSESDDDVFDTGPDPRQELKAKQTNRLIALRETRKGLSLLNDDVIKQLIAAVSFAAAVLEFTSNEEERKRRKKKMTSKAEIIGYIDEAITIARQQGNFGAQLSVDVMEIINPSPADVVRILEDLKTRLNRFEHHYVGYVRGNEFYRSATVKRRYACRLLDKHMADVWLSAGGTRGLGRDSPYAALLAWAVVEVTGSAGFTSENVSYALQSGSGS